MAIAKPTVDVFYIAPRHVELHIRLENWARWAKSDRHGRRTTPMFAQFRSKWRQWHQPEFIAPIYEQDAITMERAVMSMPETCRKLLVWYYIKRTPVHNARRTFGVTDDELWSNITHARDMLDSILQKHVE